MKQRASAKALCVVDTSALIHISGIKVADRSLIRWLQSEFEVKYSPAVWGEIQHHLKHFEEPDRKLLNRTKERFIYRDSLDTCERILFGSPFYRQIQVGTCRQCRQPIYRDEQFDPLQSPEADRGERHNCCIALYLVKTGQSSQVIFLTDDFKSLPKYIKPVFETFPLGTIWSSFDLVLYLFIKHRNRIPFQEAEDTLRNLSSRLKEPAEESARRLRIYCQKLKRINEVLTNIGGL